MVEAYRFYCKQPHLEQFYEGLKDGLDWLCDLDPDTPYEWMTYYEKSEATDNRRPMITWAAYRAKHSD